MKVIFLDRDGVINQDFGYLYKIKDFDFITGIFEACKYFQSLGFKIIVVTNQSGISRGYYKETDFHILTKWMLARFYSQHVNILDVIFCPHGPNATCKCRKPKPGMLLEARDKYGINMAESWMIGDKETDIEAANAAGVNKTILVRNGQSIEGTISKAKLVLESIKESIHFVT
ncbi:D-glycero-beta-D-manno-heptose 1,7-bisphosphate 7-phosphatase [Amylibacter sp.]|nr:D-glycero-beta-D-manno-heptose 1,7-bisphosphate 7-phosphatase [Amylibacter sp.]